MFRLVLIALVVGWSISHFGVLDWAGPKITEKLPEQAQQISPWDAPTPVPTVISEEGVINTDAVVRDIQNYRGLGTASGIAVSNTTASDTAVNGEVTPMATPEPEKELLVLSVQDGDTLTVGFERYPLRIRLAGIDAPESDQPGGERAKRYLEECAGDDIVVNVVDQDHYGRLVAYVHSAEGRNSCNMQLVREGLAYSYINPTTDILDAEQSAQQRGVGVWGDPDAIRPSDWRKGIREYAIEEEGEGGDSDGSQN